MAYELHIFRGNDRQDGSADPITAEELLSVNGVEAAGSISSVNPKTGRTLTLNMPNKNMFSYKQIIFTLNKGVITVAARNESTAEAVRPLAEALGAVIQGDDKEFY